MAAGARAAAAKVDITFADTAFDALFRPAGARLTRFQQLTRGTRVRVVHDRQAVLAAFEAQDDVLGLPDDWEASLGCDFIVENYDNGDSTYVLVKPGAFDETSATNAKDGKWWPYSVGALPWHFASAQTQHEALHGNGFDADVSRVRVGPAGVIRYRRRLELAIGPGQAPVELVQERVPVPPLRVRYNNCSTPGLECCTCACYCSGDFLSIQQICGDRDIHTSNWTRCSVAEKIKDLRPHDP